MLAKSVISTSSVMRWMWEKVLQTEVDSVVALEVEVKKLQSKMPQGEPRQPNQIEECCDNTSAEYLEVLKMEFEALDHTIFKDVKAVASKRQFVFHAGPPKKDERCLEKASWHTKTIIPI
jgi:hypothetical protein